MSHVIYIFVVIKYIVARSCVPTEKISTYNLTQIKESIDSLVYKNSKISFTILEKVKVSKKSVLCENTQNTFPDFFIQGTDGSKYLELIKTTFSLERQDRLFFMENDQIDTFNESLPSNYEKRRATKIPYKFIYIHSHIVSKMNILKSPMNILKSPSNLVSCSLINKIITPEENQFVREKIAKWSNKEALIKLYLHLSTSKTPDHYSF